jgi:hypothetical protein
MLTTAVMMGHDDEGLRELRDGKVESLTMLVSSLYTVAKRHVEIGQPQVGIYRI